MSKKRTYPLQRTLRITARTVHLASVAMVVGAAAFDGDAGRWISLLVASGAWLIGDDLYKYGYDWLRFASAWGLIVKLGILALTAVFPSLLLEGLLTALVLGSVVSHAPGAIRHWALWGDNGPCARPRQRSRNCASRTEPAR